jgi:hypothetical protein
MSSEKKTSLPIRTGDSLTTRHIEQEVALRTLTTQHVEKKLETVAPAQSQGKPDNTSSGTGGSTGTQQGAGEKNNP